MMAALCGTDHQHLLPDVSQTKNLQDLQRLLEPFEIATNQVSSQKVPTASLILPIMHKLVNYTLGELATDSTMITKAKKAIKTDLLKRYTSDEQHNLLLCVTAMDPRFKNLDWLDDTERDLAFALIKAKATDLALSDPKAVFPAQEVKQEPKSDEDDPPYPSTSVEIPDQPIHAVAFPPLPALPDLHESADTLSNSGEAEGPPTKSGNQIAKMRTSLMCASLHMTPIEPPNHTVILLMMS